jgi:ATP-dependent DNA helicase RecG
MSATVEELEIWLSEPEGERLECKEAKNNFHFGTLARYCAALANEGGGKIILGVTGRRPRRVAGSTAFQEPGRTVASLVSRLAIQVTSEEIQHPGGRVLVFHVPPRPVGVPIQYGGVFWSRAGDELRPLSPDRLLRIFQESGPDYPAELHPEATIDDLDPALIERYREIWMRKPGNAALAGITSRQLLEDAELLAGGKVTHAALVPLRTRPALDYQVQLTLRGGIQNPAFPGFPRETNNALLCKHIEENREKGSPFRQLEQVLPALSRNQVPKLLQEWKAEGRIQ